MTVFISDNLLNQVTRFLISSGIIVRIHSGPPGNTGSDNRIGNFQVEHSQDEWEIPVVGTVRTRVDSLFGVLNALETTRVESYSLYLKSGNEFIGWSNLLNPVTVIANRTFAIESGSISFVFRQTTS